MKIRQLLVALAVCSGLTFAASAASAQTQAFAVMAGGYETAAADADGVGTATVLFINGRRICYAVLVDNIATPTAMHIHKAAPGINGGVVVTLTAPNTGNPGRSSGCIGGLDPALVRDMRNNPSSYYINVHNADFPAGAIRGQLF